MVYYNHIIIVVLFFGFINIIIAENAEQREKKVFSLFSIVTFPNSGCASQSTIGTRARNGTCFTSTECTEKGGSVSGNCAAGFGVCCLFTTQTSGSTVSQNCSYIQNPNFPNAYGSEAAATYTIAKCATEICTLRLDFETFSTGGPTSTSDTHAAIDTLTITTTPSQSLGIPLLAGENSGYHAYIEVGSGADATATLAFTFGTSATTARTWEIKVTQLECSNRSRPPQGCLQYFTGPAGRIESFNFQNTVTQQHLHDQNYNICIRDEGYNCIQYSQCSDANSFSLDNVETAMKAAIGTSCTADFIRIDGGADCPNLSQINTLSGAMIEGTFCGELFSWIAEDLAAMQTAGVCDCTKPFIVNFISDSIAVENPAATTAQRGFCLDYTLY